MEDKLAITLSAAQRNLLLEYEPYLVDIDLFRLVSVAIKKGDTYEIYLDDEQLDDLLEQVSEAANDEEDEQKQEALDDLYDYLLSYHVGFEGDGLHFDEDEAFSEYSQNTGAVYVIRAALEGAPEIWRRIAIRGGQTLHDLHDLLYEAFDRYDEHLYSFFVPFRPQKTRPRHIYDKAVEYTHPYNFAEQGGEKDFYDASRTSIESMGLKEKQRFYYLFDFGDEWWHVLTVEKTAETPDEGEYPRILEREGQSPEQYPDEDEEEDWDEDEE